MRFYCRMKSRVESLAEERQGLRVRFRPSRGGQRAQAWKEAGSSAGRAAGAPGSQRPAGGHPTGADPTAVWGTVVSTAGSGARWREQRTRRGLS